MPLTAAFTIVSYTVSFAIPCYLILNLQLMYCHSVSSMPACRHESVSTSSGSCSFPIPWLSPWSPWGAPLVSAFTAAVVFVARGSNRSSSPRSSGRRARRGQKKHVARRCAPPRSKVQFTEDTLCILTTFGACTSVFARETHVFQFWTSKPAELVA